jgi:hypothetical protein
MSMKRIAAALALVMGLAVVSACGGDQAAQQPGGSNTSAGAVKPFAPEVAEQPAANYAPNIDPSNFVKDIDNPYFPLEPGTTRIYEGPPRKIMAPKMRVPKTPSSHPCM